MGQKAPQYILEKLPPLREKVETIEILRQTNKATAALAELKGIAKTIPNQAMLINAIVLQEAKLEDYIKRFGHEKLCSQLAFMNYQIWKAVRKINGERDSEDEAKAVSCTNAT